MVLEAINNHALLRLVLHFPGYSVVAIHCLADEEGAREWSTAFEEEGREVGIAAGDVSNARYGGMIEAVEDRHGTIVVLANPFHVGARLRFV